MRVIARHAGLFGERIGSEMATLLWSHAICQKRSLDPNQQEIACGVTWPELAVKMTVRANGLPITHNVRQDPEVFARNGQAGCVLTSLLLRLRGPAR